MHFGSRELLENCASVTEQPRFHFLYRESKQHLRSRVAPIHDLGQLVFELNAVSVIEVKNNNNRRIRTTVASSVASQ